MTWFFQFRLVIVAPFRSLLAGLQTHKPTSHHSLWFHECRVRIGSFKHVFSSLFAVLFLKKNRRSYLKSTDKPNSCKLFDRSRQNSTWQLGTPVPIYSKEFLFHTRPLFTRTIPRIQSRLNPLISNVRWPRADSPEIVERSPTRTHILVLLPILRDRLFSWRLLAQSAASPALPDERKSESFHSTVTRVTWSSQWNSSSLDVDKKEGANEEVIDYRNCNQRDPCVPLEYDNCRSNNHLGVFLA